MMNRRSLRVATLVAVVVMVVVGCGGTGASAIKKVAPSQAVMMLDARTVIDVRTPAEYAAGHIAGAQNIDVEAGDFSSRIASLDKKAPYLVYCHTGRRSALAADAMAAAGFTNIVDGGALSDLVAAGAKTQ